MFGTFLVLKGALLNSESSSYHQYGQSGRGMTSKTLTSYFGGTREKNSTINFKWPTNDLTAKNIFDSSICRRGILFRIIFWTFQWITLYKSATMGDIPV